MMWWFITNSDDLTRIVMIYWELCLVNENCDNCRWKSIEHERSWNFYIGRIEPGFVFFGSTLPKSSKFFCWMKDWLHICPHIKYPFYQKKGSEGVWGGIRKRESSYKKASVRGTVCIKGVNRDRTNAMRTKYKETGLLWKRMS